MIFVGEKPFGHHSFVWSLTNGCWCLFPPQRACSAGLLTCGPSAQLTATRQWLWASVPLIVVWHRMKHIAHSKSAWTSELNIWGDSHWASLYQMWTHIATLPIRCCFPLDIQGLVTLRRCLRWALALKRRITILWIQGHPGSINYKQVWHCSLASKISGFCSSRRVLFPGIYTWKLMTVTFSRPTSSATSRFLGSLAEGATVSAQQPVNVDVEVEDAVKVTALVGAFRTRGHLCARLDPLGRVKRGPWLSEVSGSPNRWTQRAPVERWSCFWSGKFCWSLQTRLWKTTSCDEGCKFPTRWSPDKLLVVPQFASSEVRMTTSKTGFWSGVRCQVMSLWDCRRGGIPDTYQTI